MRQTHLSLSHTNTQKKNLELVTEMDQHKPTRPCRRHRYNHQQFKSKASPLGPPGPIGILAALPENEESFDTRNVHEAPVSVSLSTSVSSNSSSSSRPILIIHRLSPDRTPSWSSPVSIEFYHSMPIDIPIRPKPQNLSY